MTRIDVAKLERTIAERDRRTLAARALSETVQRLHDQADREWRIIATLNQSIAALTGPPAWPRLEDDGPAASAYFGPVS
jgi:hypothetical protein